MGKKGNDFVLLIAYMKATCNWKCKQTRVGHTSYREKMVECTLRTYLYKLVKI